VLDKRIALISEFSAIRFWKDSAEGCKVLRSMSIHAGSYPSQLIACTPAENVNDAIAICEVPLPRGNNADNAINSPVVALLTVTTLIPSPMYFEI